MNQSDELSKDAAPSARREVFKRTSLAAGALLLGGALTNAARSQEAAAPQPTATPQPTPQATANGALMTATEAEAAEAAAVTAGDMDLLNLVLQTEYLLHDLYLRVAQANQPGEGKRLYIRGHLGELVPTFRDNKAAHIVALTKTIADGGGAVAPRGAYNFPADVFLSPLSFGEFAATLEELSAGAALGALNEIQDGNRRADLAALYGGTTRQASLIRLLNGLGFSPRYFENAISAPEVRRLIAPYLA